MKGGTARLGSYKCVLAPKSKVAKLYGKELIEERHRHRYEINSAYCEKLEQVGVEFVGMHPESKLIEVIELQNHPFFIVTNFLPEYKSKPYRPHPVFLGLINTAKSIR
jgi:CTP synthase